MTTATIRKMGNSLGVVIPKTDVRTMHLKAGDRVFFEVRRAGSMADIAGILKGKIGNVAALMKEVDEDEEL